MRYVPRGSINFILSLFSPSGGQREMGWWEFLGLWWSGRGADEELYFLIFISWWSSLGGGKTCQNEALISWRESLQEVCLQINTEKKNINKPSFGRLILAWTYRDNRSCFSCIVAKHSLPQWFYTSQRPPVSQPVWAELWRPLGSLSFFFFLCSVSWYQTAVAIGESRRASLPVCRGMFSTEEPPCC